MLLIFFFLLLILVIYFICLTENFANTNKNFHLHKLRKGVHKAIKNGTFKTAATELKNNLKKPEFIQKVKHNIKKNLNDPRHLKHTLKQAHHKIKTHLNNL
jgi:hypothetical protein